MAGPKKRYDNGNKFYSVSPKDGSAAASVVRKNSKYGKKAMKDLLETKSGPSLPADVKRKTAAIFGGADAAGEASGKAKIDAKFFKHTTKGK